MCSCGFIILELYMRACNLLMQALLQALGDRKGINRFGDFSAPLDEACIHVVLVWLWLRVDFFPALNITGLKLWYPCVLSKMSSFRNDLD